MIQPFEVATSTGIQHHVASAIDPVLKAMGLDGFKPVTDSQYDIMRRLMGVDQLS